MEKKRMMDRKEFFEAIGIGVIGVAITSCIGCSKSSTGPGAAAPSNIDFTIDLNANAPLLTNGGYLAMNGVIIARTTSGTYIAVQQSCTHERYNLNYQAVSHRFYCNNHGATFTEAGVVTAGPTNRSLTVYNTQLTGTSLRVYS